MSGYGDRQGSAGGDDRSRRRSISPRGDRRDRGRDDRSFTGTQESRYGRRGDGGSRGGRYSGRGSDGSSTYTSPSGVSSLPSIVSVPPTGREFNASTAPMKGSIGKPTRIMVNHYEIQSLPTVKTYTYEVSYFVITALN